MYNMVDFLYIQITKINYITDHIYNHIFKFSVHLPVLKLKAGEIAQNLEFVFFKKYKLLFSDDLKIHFPLKK